MKNNSSFDPRELVPINPVEFMGLFRRAMLAGAKKISSPDPTKYGLSIKMSDGTVQHLSPTDIPMNRAALAIREEYGNDLDMFKSIMFRIMALMKILQEGRLRKWRKSDPDCHESELIHPAVLHAAAILPLNREGWFSPTLMTREVARLARYEYPDEE